MEMEKPLFLNELLRGLKLFPQHLEVERISIFEITNTSFQVRLTLRGGKMLCKIISREIIDSLLVHGEKENV